MTDPLTYGVDQRRAVLPTAPRRLYRWLSRAIGNGAQRKRLEGAKLAQCLGLSLRTVRRALASQELKDRLEERGYQIIRERHGRTYHLYLVRVTLHLYRELPKGSKYKHRPRAASNSAKAGSIKMPAPNPKKLSALAHFLAKDWIRTLPWDNCKVTLDPPMLYLYALDGLMEGLDWERLEAVLSHALHQRHAQATDEGLSSGSPSLKYHCSSTISLAREILNLPRQDRTKPKQWNPS